MLREKSYYSLLDHTADIGIVVEDQSFSAVLEKSALAVFDIMIDIKTVNPSHCVTINLPEADKETCLRGWLEQLLFHFNTDDFLFSRFKIIEQNGEPVSGLARGEKYNPDKHVIHTEIKAITYHQFKVYQTAGIWKAQMIFDV